MISLELRGSWSRRIAIQRELRLHFATKDLWECNKSVIEAVVDKNLTWSLIRFGGC